jgi:hypothetical protein
MRQEPTPRCTDQGRERGPAHYVNSQLHQAPGKLITWFDYSEGKKKQAVVQGSLLWFAADRPAAAVVPWDCSSPAVKYFNKAAFTIFWTLLNKTAQDRRWISRTEENMRNTR